jgi:hypothetical protein
MKDRPVSSRAATRTQHAVRLLALLDVCGTEVGGNDPVGVVKAIRSERRLQALDFWLRNPDYLADEILNAIDLGALSDDYTDTAQRLVTDQEPSWHHFPMPKWFYGAYEAVDDAFALLQGYGLALVQRRGTPGNRLQNQFFLTEFGAEKAGELQGLDRLAWYPQQASLVALVAGDDSGTRLKERQYNQEAYAQAVWGTEIGSIRDQVEARLAAITSAPVGVVDDE